MVVRCITPQKRREQSTHQSNAAIISVSFIFVLIFVPYWRVATFEVVKQCIVDNNEVLRLMILTGQ